ncbi:oxidoreductase molybdopterin binding domain protein [Klebsiella pneumoniae subsp. rhinoscleromatis ATCC 13884]|uniref:Sulfite oxidase subunit YedY n=1 Tax=Klebsiella pneumoniae TaxID=573 RepID=A0A377X473_KLEPN|nr:oxidoreductase molybdopterin binding domain protein [Klebsiella pneumoniae subsp. rhinoscleromatis ATCC 13884]STT68570.1 sulfite oxidase subunit YedY [Klebsiella pneumoniae]STW03457.1 sulfite oxidase subunit YedY [Klebsiella pneumoniae subsp. rhinoscleromatis]STT78425.1 sulfite oxidase subunit YedY [Klebsiella pneumoniae]STU10684.1 sulfite oxidase subunit YedY [Klebsiella pneumoniae]
MKNKIKKSRFLSDSDAHYLVQDAENLLSPARRRLLRQGLTLGGTMMLTGCDISDNDDVEKVLSRMSRLNDRVQGFLFSNQTLAPVYAYSEITRPFPFNAFYGPEDIPHVNGLDYRLEIRGLVRDARSWRLAELYKMQQMSQITRHICVEGWSAIGQWGGISFRHFLTLIGADMRAKYVSFRCADEYYTSIDMATALHPQTLLALTWDNKILPPEYGYPMKLRIPTKLGYKNPKHIQVIEITNRFPGGYWEDQGYNWFGGS